MVHSHFTSIEDSTDGVLVSRVDVHSSTVKRGMDQVPKIRVLGKGSTPFRRGDNLR